MSPGLARFKFDTNELHEVNPEQARGELTGISYMPNVHACRKVNSAKYIQYLTEYGLLVPGTPVSSTRKLIS